MRRRGPTGVLAAFMATIIFPASGTAQPKGSLQTRDFVQAASQTDTFEILEATTALAQSEDQQIRGFARAMIEAHQETTAALRQAVAKAGLDAPKPGPSGDQSLFLSALQSQFGPDFDRNYRRQQLLVHYAALAVMQSYAASGDDPVVRQVAAATIPIVSSHLAMLEQRSSSHGGPR